MTRYPIAILGGKMPSHPCFVEEESSANAILPEQMLGVARFGNLLYHFSVQSFTLKENQRCPSKSRK